MSIAICRVDKCSHPHDVAGIQIHDRRERDHSNTNPDIDHRRTKQNYSLCDTANGKTFNQTINQIINDRYTNDRAIRKDAVRMVQLLFTSDNEFFANKTAEETKQFFQSCYAWAKERFGAENIISADVHMDERTPHMHLNFVPLVEDVKKKTGEIVTTLNVHKAVGSGSRAMQKLQDEFYKAVGKEYGMERGTRADLNDPKGPKPRMHQRVGEYKASTNYYLEQAKQALNSVKQDMEAVSEQKRTLTDDYNALQAAYNALQANIATLNEQKHQWEEERLREHSRLSEKEMELAQREQAVTEREQNIENEISEYETKLKRWQEMYDDACSCGEYICDKLDWDWDNILDMKMDGYSLEYIIDEGHGR